MTTAILPVVTSRFRGELRSKSLVAGMKVTRENGVSATGTWSAKMSDRCRSVAEKSVGFPDGIRGGTFRSSGGMMFRVLSGRRRYSSAMAIVVEALPSCSMK
jgi:hypothetical protein